MQIYYYTRTGRSKKIASKLGEKYGLEINEITDDENWNGAINFLKGGAFACQKKETLAIYDKPNLEKQIILVFPIWAGSFPPAVRNFVENNSNIIAVPTSLGTKLKEREKFVEIFDLVGKEISVPNLKL